MIKKRTLSIFFGLLILIIVGYWGVWDGFFQQDEWAGLSGFFAVNDLKTFDLIREMQKPLLGQGLAHFAPLTVLGNFLRYTIFGLNYLGYALTSLILHFISTILVFILSLHLLRNKLASLLVASFFAISASGSQAIIWVGTSIPTQFAAIFSLASLIFWLNWLNVQKSKLLFLSILFLIFAISSKETALFLLILLPALGIYYRRKLTKQFLMIFLLLIVSYFFVRFFIINLSIDTLQLFGQASYAYLSVLPRGIVQAFLPSEIVLSFVDISVGRSIGEYFGLIKGDPAYDLFLEKDILRPLLSMVGILILVALGFYYRFQKEFKFAVFFSIVLLVSSFAPIAFITTGELDSAFLSPRSLYIPIIGVSIILGMLVKDFIFRNKLVLGIVVAVFTIHFFALRAQIVHFTGIGEQRREILNQIKSAYPKLPQKVIFYTESDKAFYGLPDDQKIMPFQSGFGQTLLVWYHPTSHFPREFFNKKPFWPITSQGYEEFGGRGFGYFRDFELMAEIVVSKNLPLEGIISFRYNSSTTTLDDITKEIRERLKVTPR